METQANRDRHVRHSSINGDNAHNERRARLSTPFGPRQPCRIHSLLSSLSDYLSIPGWGSNSGLLILYAKQQRSLYAHLSVLTKESYRHAIVEMWTLEGPSSSSHVSFIYLCAAYFPNSGF